VNEGNALGVLDVHMEERVTVERLDDERRLEAMLLEGLGVGLLDPLECSAPRRHVDAQRRGARHAHAHALGRDCEALQIVAHDQLEVVLGVGLVLAHEPSRPTRHGTSRHECNGHVYLPCVYLSPHQW
jgi:hypothetical protein